MGRERGCLSPPPLTLTAGSSGVQLEGADPLLGAESLGVPAGCQPGTSHRCPCLCRPLGTAMAGDGELNRIIKDLQSKCASPSPASMSLAWHISPWPCRVTPRTQPVGSRGVHCWGCSRASQCQLCHCCLLLSSLPAPGDRQCLADTCAPRSPCSPISSQGRFLFHPLAEIPGLGGSGEEGWDGAGCLLPGQGRASSALPSLRDRRRAEPRLPRAELASDGWEPGAAQPLCPAGVPPPGITASLSPPLPASVSPGVQLQAEGIPHQPFWGGGMTPASIVQPWPSPAMQAPRPGSPTSTCVIARAAKGKLRHGASKKGTVRGHWDPHCWGSWLDPSPTGDRLG